jgi:hypothetical protein
MSKKKNLKGTTIYVNDDNPKDVRKKLSILRSKEPEMRDQQPHARIFIRNQTLYVKSGSSTKQYIVDGNNQIADGPRTSQDHAMDYWRNGQSIQQFLQNFSLLCWNIEGLTWKTKAFYNNIVNNNPSIFFSSETWHKNKFSYKSIQNYDVTERFEVRENRKCRLSKGFILGVRKDERHKCTITTSTDEYCILQYSENERHLNIVFLHVPPSSTTDIDEAINNITSNAPIILIGDFNARIGHFTTSDSNPRILRIK